MKRALPFAVVIVFLILLSVWVWKRFLNSDRPPLAHASFLPDPMIEDRARIELGADLEGQLGTVTLVSFWSADCALCFSELNQLSELASRYKAWNLKVIAIEITKSENREAQQEGEETTVESLAEKIRAIPEILVASPSPTDLTRLGLLGKIFGTLSVPATALLDSEKRLALRSTGSNDWLSADSLQVIEDLIVEAHPEIVPAQDEPTSELENETADETPAQ